MKELILKQIILKNFKGLKNLTVNFDISITNISGDNGTGKTTIIDSFLWLLFDKDSTNRKDFKIKTLDENNEPLHGLEHSVIATILIDSKEFLISKIYKETWTKKRGESLKLLTGHTTSYSINDVPYKKSDYQIFINDLIDEVIFKIVTIPFYFSTQINKEKRRDILLDISDNPIIEQSTFLSELLAGKTEKQLKDSLNSKKRKLNEQLTLIPARIDEVSSSITMIENRDKITKEEILLQNFQEIENSILNFTDSFSGQKKILEQKRLELFNIEETATKKKNNELSKLRELLSKQKIDLEEMKNNLDSINRYFDSASNQIVQTNKELLELGQDFEEANSLEFIFDNISNICPTCQQELQEKTISENNATLLSNFNTAKAKELTKINEAGKISVQKKNELLEGLSKTEKSKKLHLSKFATLSKLIGITEKNISDCNNIIPSFPDSYSFIKSEIAELLNVINNPDNTEHKQSLIDKKDIISTELEEISNIKNDIKENKKRTIRIVELEKEQTNVSNQIAKIEKGLFALENFTFQKAKALEKNINSKFHFVKFKLFDTQINGAIIEDCEVLINGVPFADANNAAKYNAGLDIINTLSEYYKISAPIFIDNRESVNNLISTKSQLINLFVNKNKRLTFDNNKLKEVA